MIKKTKQTGQIIFGIHPIIELLKAKRRKLLALYTTRPEPKIWQTITRLIPPHSNIPVQYVPRDVLHKLAQTTDHQGIVAYAQPFVLRKKFFDPERYPLLVMLDGIQDVHNAGAIMRSTYCTGFHGIILCQKQSAPITAAVIKASAGLAEHMDIYISPSPQAAVQALKKAGYTIYLTFFDGNNAATCLYKTPLCIVIGNEATGISREIAKDGIHITLPQHSDNISYNASVAAGITLFLAARSVGKLA